MTQQIVNAITPGVAVVPPGAVLKRQEISQKRDVTVLEPQLSQTFEFASYLIRHLDFRLVIGRDVIYAPAGI